MHPECREEINVRSPEWVWKAQRDDKAHQRFSLTTNTVQRDVCRNIASGWSAGEKKFTQKLGQVCKRLLSCSSLRWQWHVGNTAGVGAGPWHDAAAEHESNVLAMIGLFFVVGWGQHTGHRQTSVLCSFWWLSRTSPSRGDALCSWFSSVPPPCPAWG